MCLMYLLNYIWTYVINNTGQIKSYPENGCREAEKVPDMFRFGMQMQMPDEFYESTIMGRGPVENYSDRNHATIWEFIARRWLNNSILYPSAKRVLRLIYVGGEQLNEAGSRLQFVLKLRSRHRL